MPHSCSFIAGCPIHCTGCPILTAALSPLGWVIVRGSERPPSSSLRWYLGAPSMPRSLRHGWGFGCPFLPQSHRGRVGDAAPRKAPKIFPQKPQQIRVSSPCAPKNPSNPHCANHFPPKNSWHTSFPPTRIIKVVINIQSPALRRAFAFNCYQFRFHLAKS